ncbi:MAG: ABC1 kinase family protein [Eggerthellaceae bacterium]
MNRTDLERSSKRFKEILGIINKHEVRKGISPQESVALLEDLGPTFVKLGQIASTHPDMLPEEYCAALGTLRTKVKPMDLDTVKMQIQQELGKPVDELFSSFDEHAVGSASIAQVHRATLSDGNTEVAVKVQRPGIIESTAEDLAILHRLVDLYDLVSRDNQKLSLKELVDELERTSAEELDFNVEAGNLERFYENNKDRDRIRSPRCYEKLSTHGVLTEDYFSSPCVEDIDSLDLSQADRDDLAYLIARNYVQQIMEDGFFHADPHAGNILITPEKNVEWIDFGMMGQLTSHDREIMGDVIASLAKGDAYGLKRSMLQIATPTGPIDHGVLLERCERLIDEYFNSDLASFDTGKMLNEIMTMLQDNGFEIAPFALMMGRGLVTLEGTIKLVSSNLNIMKVLVDYMTTSVDPNKYQSKMRRMLGQSIDSAEASTALPTKTTETLDMLQKGQLKFAMSLDLSDESRSLFKSTVGDLSLMVLAGFMFIGSCILCLTNLQPQIAGVPALGIVGFTSSIILAAYVVLTSARGPKRFRKKR